MILLFLFLGTFSIGAKTYSYHYISQLQVICQNIRGAHVMASHTV